MRHPVTAPKPSINTFTDVRHYIINKPPYKTLVQSHNSDARKEVGKSILQRTGVDVLNYKMLNLHRIGIDAPASYVFDELLKWNGDSICWPNNLARVNLQNDQLEHIKINLFGIKKKLFGWNIFHLFDLESIRIQKVPSSSDFDNARYLLYECKGGYPIGIFSMYVRSSIPERGEKEMSQLFSLVSFNFYGRDKSRFKLFNSMWEMIHNRVTANVVYRFKQLCEYKFNEFVNE